MEIRRRDCPGGDWSIGDFFAIGSWHTADTCRAFPAGDKNGKSYEMDKEVYLAWQHIALNHAPFYAPF